jgi:hypothetical protein
VTFPVPEVTSTPVGALGTVAGVTALEAIEGVDAVVEAAP